MMLARERSQRFAGFEHSRYASGAYFSQYLEGDWQPKTEKVRELFARAGITLPTREMWQQLRDDVMRYGIYNQNLQAVPPTGSISYINHATSSIHPIVSKIEIRKEGKTGRVYYPAPFMTNENWRCIRTRMRSARRKSSIPTRRQQNMWIRGCRLRCSSRTPPPRGISTERRSTHGRKASKRSTTFACASLRWKAPKSKAACPARCKEKG